MDTETRLLDAIEAACKALRRVAGLRTYEATVSRLLASLERLEAEHAGTEVGEAASLALDAWLDRDRDDRGRLRSTIAMAGFALDSLG